MKIKKRSVSQWRAQLGALALDIGAKDTAEARSEAQLMAELRLPSLTLPPRENSRAGGAAWQQWSRPLWIATGLAAALLLIILPRHGDTIRTKGGNHIRLFWERDGVSHALEEGTSKLKAGDRVLAEIEASKDSVAYWLVTDAQGKLLVGSDFIAASALPLKAGSSTSFAQSLRIVGEPVGETLIVFICDGSELDRLTLTRVAPAVGQAFASETLPERCTKTMFKLR